MAGRSRAPTTFINLSRLITLILIFSSIDLLKKTLIRSAAVFYCENVCMSGNFFIMKATCLRTSSRTKYLRAQLSYDPNSDCCFQLARIATSGDVKKNPGPTVERKRSREKSTKSACTGCDNTLRKNQNGVLCSGCTGQFPLKCTGMKRKELNSYLENGTCGNGTWLCFNCCMTQFTDSFFEDLVNEEILSVMSNDDSIPDSLEWFSGNVSSYSEYQLHSKQARWG